MVGRPLAERRFRLLHGIRRSESRASKVEDGEVLDFCFAQLFSLIYTHNSGSVEYNDLAILLNICYIIDSNI